jgi:hypothetical protein
MPHQGPTKTVGCCCYQGLHHTQVVALCIHQADANNGTAADQDDIMMTCAPFCHVHAHPCLQLCYCFYVLSCTHRRLLSAD